MPEQLIRRCLGQFAELIAENDAVIEFLSRPGSGLHSQATGLPYRNITAQRIERLQAQNREYRLLMLSASSLANDRSSDRA